MEKSKIDVNCDVKACVYNKNGSLCTRDNIKICEKEDNGHICSSFEKITGFGK